MEQDKRLIDADRIILDYSDLAKIAPNDFIGIAKYFADQIKATPTIDPESLRPHGEWDYIEDDWNDTVAVKCSQCGAEFFGEDIRSFDQFRYCPNCGAKMVL